MKQDKWWKEFKRLAKKHDLPIFDDFENYRDFYDDDATPIEAFETEYYYAVEATDIRLKL